MSMMIDRALASDDRWQQPVSQYLKEVEDLSKESARSHRFGMLLQQLLGFEPQFIERYSKGIETSLKTHEKDRLLRGEADNLFGNTVIEFESALPKKRAEAEKQLRKYVAILWSEEPVGKRTPYLCIATDGVRFLTYTPKLLYPEKVSLKVDDITLAVIEEAQWDKLKPYQVFYWLDRHLLRQQTLYPSSEAIAADFGVKSHAFQSAVNILLPLWRKLSTKPGYSVLYDSWRKYLLIVYGSEVAEDELFVRHTYLATLAKLMAWMRITQSASLPPEPQIVEILEGLSFKRQGIENFIEEDFFSWLGRAKAVKAGAFLIRWLFSLLQNYRLAELSEDVFKSLYQELVDPETRHYLGEYYTPDWLAHLIVSQAMLEKPDGKILDPACGSGTFLYLAIREKRARLEDSADALPHILESVCGADVHPLAVIVAKTNYILALGDLLDSRTGSITIPVYLADTLKLPELVRQAALPGSGKPERSGYRVFVEGRWVYLIDQLIDRPALYDLSIEFAKEFARQNKKKHTSLERFTAFLKAQEYPQVDNDTLVEALYDIATHFKDFIDAERDTIWAFVLKNIYKPLFFKRSFDFVVGNPPWITFKDTDAGYQPFLKRQITEHYWLLRGKGELVTHLEIGTLFFIHAADLYLKTGASIGFVLPKSTFIGGQHDGLRRRTFKFYESVGQSLYFEELWDCERVNPLFNVPSCVVFGRKKTVEEGYTGDIPPVPGLQFSGRLVRKNESLVEALKVLSITKESVSLNIKGKRSYWSIGKASQTKIDSFYKDYFAQGATIVPRSFWYVAVEKSPVGFNPKLPPVASDERAMEDSKKAYKGVKLEGNIESDFLFGTVLSSDVLPFVMRAPRLTLLPIEVRTYNKQKRYFLVKEKEAQERGFLNLASWLHRAEEEWVQRRTRKARGIAAVEWLNYRNKLTEQSPTAKYAVLYPDVQRVAIACVVQKGPHTLQVGKQHLKLDDLLIDHTCYYYETDNLAGANYLAAVLNSSIIDVKLAGLRRRAQKSHPHVHKKIFDVAAIPRYDSSNPFHNQLAALGQQCAAKAAKWLASAEPANLTAVRRKVRELLASELKDIDFLVEQIL